MRHRALIDRFRAGFPPGRTSVTREGEPSLDTGMDFEIVRLAEGETVAESHAKESAWLLLSGAASVALGGARRRVARASLFDEGPACLHAGPGAPVELRALAECEWAVFRAANRRRFEPRLFLPEDVAPERRGRGLAQEAALRDVRLIFDWNVRPESNLVLGEVLNYPGRWSSYPPHHHPQPELYHYRFTLPQGYGHGELGDEVLQVRQHDTLKILDGAGHSQTAAPGYGMYYIWAVRHLEGNPYRGFHFNPDHAWTLDPERQGWRPGREPVEEGA
ncbi:MAG: 5-deoxy-glucuronate isomerase [Elusimicrobia bacterium]|nr:5-deoxy-glucuronate isomerase [Elusimicrobiota bacterium]